MIAELGTQFVPVIPALGQGRGIASSSAACTIWWDRGLKPTKPNNQPTTNQPTNQQPANQPTITNQPTNQQHHPTRKQNKQTKKQPKQRQWVRMSSSRGLRNSEVKVQEELQRATSSHGKCLPNPMPHMGQSTCHIPWHRNTSVERNQDYC